MTTDGFQRRLQQLSQDERLGNLDLRLPENVDIAARILLARFQSEDEPRLFDLLLELTEPFLRESARQVARQVGLALDPDELVVAFYSHLFIDPEKRLPDTPTFLSDSTEALRDEAQQLVSQVARLVIDEEEGARPRLYTGPLPDAVAKLQTPYQRVVAVCFHRLPLDERRVLRALDVEQLSINTTALALGTPAPQVRSLESQARQGLALALSQVTEGGPDDS
ncbi:MAG: hypothetical protein DHS20C15_19480 [Planctomycetota bacterium]|nr:MAG: hypothetical protein DHS20C15_19480 [Planctomycetota bacterium]